MIKLGLIGSGISGSRMPRLQTYLGRLSGVEVDYQIIDTGDNSGFSLQAEIKHREAQGYRGLNITHPYKQQVVSLAEPISRHVATIGAMNTLLFSDDGWKGATTDYTGFKQGYRYRRKGQKPGRVLIAGAGGVGRAIAFALGDLGAEHLFIFDTHAGQAKALADALTRTGTSATMVEANAFTDIAQGSTGLVNATPLGMHKYPGSAFPTKVIRRQEWAFDAVYTPLITPFMEACQSADLEVVTGYDLWLFQGLDAFELFTGFNVDADNARKEALSWLD
ncbi:MAG: shikimate dehydrogenase [Motiliproteus sp.]